MLFDAGAHGIIEVDKIIEREKCTVGIIHPDDPYRQIRYTNWGKKLGCTKVELVPPKDMSPEARARQRQRMIDVALSIVDQMALKGG